MMREHSASVTIHAPIHQVYALFSHLGDFPKYMSAVREVTYEDEQRTHWVVQIGRSFAWEAVDEDWLVDEQIGWRSISGLRNSGKVKFRALAAEQTMLDVYIQYEPPLGLLGLLGEVTGAGSYGAAILQKDLDHFAKMVEQTPAGALDPMASHYLFHPESAAAKKLVTSRQLVAWQEDPRMSPQALAEREARIAQEAEQLQCQQVEREAANKLAAERAEQWLQAQRELLAQEAERRRQEQLAEQAIVPRGLEMQLDTQAYYAVWAHSLGDRDGLRARISNVTRDPMTTRRPPFNLNL